MDNIQNTPIQETKFYLDGKEVDETTLQQKKSDKSIRLYQENDTTFRTLNRLTE